jgi:large conductance mechanosensitive channel
MKPAASALSLAQEFKSFALKGNVVDLAVGVIIGAAFTAVVQSLVKNVIMPFIAFFLPGNAAYTDWKLAGIQFGAFLGEVVNFLIVAFVLFLFIVKFLGWITKTKKEEAAAPTTKDCPYCLSTIPLKATRCAHCTSEVGNARA